MFEKIIQAIRENDPIILHRHWNPDGDALGSQIGLKHLILTNYQEDADTKTLLLNIFQDTK